MARDHLEDLGIDGKIILNFFFFLSYKMGECGLDQYISRHEQTTCCELDKDISKSHPFCALFTQLYSFYFTNQMNNINYIYIYIYIYIHTHNKGISPTSFGTSVPSAGKTKCQL